MKTIGDPDRHHWGPWEDVSDALVFHTLSRINRALRNRCWSVQISYEDSPFGTLEHYWIRRHDNKTVVTWAHLQRIKNELAGRERYAVQVFPPMSELVDRANMYHLYVFPEGYRLPYGFYAQKEARHV